MYYNDGKLCFITKEAFKTFNFNNKSIKINKKNKLLYN